MEGKSRIAVSEIVKVLMEQGAVKSKTTAYDWIEKETVGFGKVVENGQKFWEGDFSKLFAWLKNKLGEKEVVREIVEQGVPLKEYKEVLGEVRRLEREVAQKEAEVKVIEGEKREFFKRYEELQKKLEELQNLVDSLKKTLKEKEERIKELEKTLKLNELEKALSSLSEKALSSLSDEDRKRFLKELEKELEKLL